MDAPVHHEAPAIVESGGFSVDGKLFETRAAALRHARWKVLYRYSSKNYISAAPETLILQNILDHFDEVMRDLEALKK